MEPIDRFDGEYAFLSNFHPSVVELDGERYPTIEHAFQAAKTLDPVSRRKIRESPGPGMAKRRGRLCSLRANWDAMKVHVMRRLVEQKFAPGSELAERLVATGDAKLVEGNTWGDKFWGVSLKEADKGQGLNWLGELLMEQRKVLGGR